MGDPIKASDNQQTSASGPAQTNADTASNPLMKPQKQGVRPWILFILLIGLVALLIVRDDLRQNAGDSSEKAVRYLAFDILGWSSRDVFVWRLRLAGLLDSPLGQQWAGAVERASGQPLQVGDTYRTSDTFEDDRVEARVYQVVLERGELLISQLNRLDNSAGRLYASLERRERGGQGWSTVADLETDGTTKSRVVSSSGDYRIVLQPELFAKVEYSLAIAHGGSLPFPVEGASQRDIGSRFGAPRDGGVRAHHGVDIFAKKGTPVKAVIAGQVRTGTGGIGGNHVWLSGGLLELGGARYYYAHLDSFEIESGDRVKKGEILGYVGNTGNARTTPPHLHFGIYSGGPVDPAPFLKPEPVLPDG